MMKFFSGRADAEYENKNKGLRSNEPKEEGDGLVNNKDVKDINDELVCRICLGEEEEPSTNPLFSPCVCSGSMGLIHLECLK
jgi:pSer/pThr/pTyr-binding forkhead associated (FHA) protein